MQEQKPLLEVKNLRTYFYTRKGVVPAVDGVDFQIKPGEILGIVGESGCGKSVTSLSILNLLIDYAKIEEGSEINFEGKNLAEFSKKEMCQVRGKDIAMIFQDPMTSLNPVMTIEKQLMETVQAHQNVSKAEAKKLALEMMIKVGIPSPEKRLKEYPHQLSGGMKQRVMIAMALMCNPKLLIADEPTTALDVTIQAQILKLMRDLRDETGSAIMLITHDMGVVASMADAIMIMYAGRVVEYGSAQEVFANPKHPYTRGLLKSIPRLDERVDTLFTIEGTVPNQSARPAGCKFWPRGPYATETWKAEEPALEKSGACQVRCWNYDGKTLKEESEA